MTLQVLPPELLEAPKDRIETKEPQPYWKPSSLKDGESEEFRLLGCYETGHAIMGWQYASEARGSDGELKFNGYESDGSEYKLNVQLPLDKARALAKELTTDLDNYDKEQAIKAQRELEESTEE